VDGPDEGVGFLVDEVADGAGVGGDFNEPEALMAAIRLFVSERPAFLSRPCAQNK
jgi:hypothetical protein